MKPEWTRDTEGDYVLELPTGQKAWITKNSASRNQPAWNGRVIGKTGMGLRVSGSTLASAKSSAESLLGLR